MNDDEYLSALSGAIERGDGEEIRALLTAKPQLVDPARVAYWFRVAARSDQVGVMAVLVEFGADVNAPESDADPEGPIDSAAGAGATAAVNWLLDRGAKINFTVDGAPRCLPLSSAAIAGHLEVIKVLVEKGHADINAVSGGYNALAFAEMYDKAEIAAYLRSKGAVEPPPSR